MVRVSEAEINVVAVATEMEDSNPRTKPKAGHGGLVTAAHAATKSSTGMNVNMCTTDDSTKSMNAFAHYIHPEKEEMKIV